MLELHHKCPNVKCTCQKQIIFTPKLFGLEGSGFKCIMAEIFEGTRFTWKKLLRPTVNVAAPFIVKAVGAKTKKPRAAHSTTNTLKSINGSKVLSITDTYANWALSKSFVKFTSNKLSY